MIIYRILAALIGYAFGNITVGLLIGKAMHVDIRKEGSGNIGTTNTLRLLGVRAGAVTLACDCLKAVAAALVAWLVFSHVPGCPAEFLPMIRLYAAFGTVIGHDFPIALRFRGGKGIATGMGFLLVADPKILVVALSAFIIIVALTRYVSLGSIVAAVSLPVQAVIYCVLGRTGYGTYAVESTVVISLVGCLAVALHHANIGRLLRHQERKFSFHPKTVTEQDGDHTDPHDAVQQK